MYVGKKSHSVTPHLILSILVDTRGILLFILIHNDKCLAMGQEHIPQTLT